MKRQWHRIVAVSVTLSFLVIATGGVTHAKKFPRVCFQQQDAVAKFPNVPAGEADGVLVGTMTGDLNGVATTNFRFDLAALPLGQANAHSSTLFVDPDGDQVLFRVFEPGIFLDYLTDPDPTRPTHFNLPSGPFGFQATVIDATGKYTYLLGRAFEGRGVGVVSAQAPGQGAVYVAACSVPGKGH